MRKSYRTSAPGQLVDTTKDAITACKATTDAALQKCAEFLGAINTGKITISSGAIEVLDLTAGRRDTLARAANALSNVWFDVAIGSKFDLPSLQQRLDPINDLLTANAQTKPVTASANG